MYGFALIHCRDCLKLSFDYARRDFRKVVYSTTDAKKLTDILQPIAIRNQQNMVISPRYEVKFLTMLYLWTCVNIVLYVLYVPVVLYMRLCYVQCTYI